MILYIFAAIASFIMTLLLSIATIQGVEKQYPEEVLKQMIAGCWFFGIMTILSLFLSPAVSYMDNQIDAKPEISTTLETVPIE